MSEDTLALANCQIWAVFNTPNPGPVLALLASATIVSFQQSVTPQSLVTFSHFRVHSIQADHTYFPDT